MYLCLHSNFGDLRLCHPNMATAISLILTALLQCNFATLLSRYGISHQHI